MKVAVSLNMVTKVSEIKDIVKKGITNPKVVFPEIKRMAESKDWKVREVAATALVEISKKNPDEVVLEMTHWAESSNPNVRRTASEGLRELARKDVNKILPVIEKLKTDNKLYVKKSVANVLRNAGRYNPEFVITLCRKWADIKNPDTHWIIKDGLRKLKESHETEVKEILNLISS